MLDEQEVALPDSETHPTRGSEEDCGEHHAAEVQVIQQITSFHSTPLPDAATLRAYAVLIPNGAERIMGLVEREAAHRHRQDCNDSRHLVRGHWMAYTLAVALSGAGLYLGTLGHDWLAATLFMTTIGAVVTTLVVERRARTDVDAGDQEPRRSPSNSANTLA